MKRTEKTPRNARTDLGSCTTQVKGPMGIAPEIGGRDYAAGIADA